MLSDIVTDIMFGTIKYEYIRCVTEVGKLL